MAGGAKLGQREPNSQPHTHVSGVAVDAENNCKMNYFVSTRVAQICHIQVTKQVLHKVNAYDSSRSNGAGNQSHALTLGRNYIPPSGSFPEPLIS